MSLVHVCLLLSDIARTFCICCVMVDILPCISEQLLLLQVHHKIAEVDGTADLKMASSPTLPLPTLAPLTAHAWCVPLVDKG